MNTDNLIEILGRIVGKNPIRSQREACTVAARRAIAAFGPAREDQTRDVCIGLASGLFGEAYAGSDATEQDRMIALVEEEYRKSRGH